MGRFTVGAALLVTAAIIAGLLWWSWDRSEPPRPNGITVIGGRNSDTAQATLPVDAPHPDPTSSTPEPPARAVARKGSPDSRMMANVIAKQPADAKSSGHEAAVRSALTTWTGARLAETIDVTCTITACEVSGVAVPGTDQATLEPLLRDPPFLHAMMGRALSPGPATVATLPDGRLGFAFYLNREM